MTYKALKTNDMVSTRTLLHEAIPLTGTIVSGTYGDNNIKDYGHQMFQSVYDYPYLSSSANHIFDITVGIGANSALYSSVVSQQAKKKNIYNQMSQILMGYDATGSIQQLDEDGDLIAGGNKLNDVFVVPFSRLLTKDEIKKETFEMQLGVNAAYATPFTTYGITISDIGAATEYRVNSPAGEYGILYATASGQELNPTSTHTASIGGKPYWYAGLLFYQAGIMVLTSSIFSTTGQLNTNGIAASSPATLKFNATEIIDAVLTSSTNDIIANDFRHRIKNIQFNNTTELNSTVYFCRVEHNEFNYSSNPTYVSQSKIRVKTIATDDPVAYITTVGMYSDNNELMATAKLSEPLKKTPSTEYTIRVRLDY